MGRLVVGESWGWEWDCGRLLSPILWFGLCFVHSLERMCLSIANPPFPFPTLRGCLFRFLWVFLKESYCPQLESRPGGLLTTFSSVLILPCRRRHLCVTFVPYYVSDMTLRCWLKKLWFIDFFFSFRSKGISIYTMKWRRCEEREGAEWDGIGLEVRDVVMGLFQM